MAVNLDEIRKKYEELKQKKSNSDTDWMELQDGDNLVRFLSDDEGNFYHETGYHYIKQGKNRVAVVCNRLNAGEDCYLCDVVSELYKSKDKTDKELAKELSVRARIFFNVVDRADNNKVKVLGAGNMIFKDLLKYFADEDWGDLTDPVAGRDVVINKSGSGMDTEYTVMPKPKTTKLGCEVELHDLGSIPYPHSNEEQEMLLNGMTTEEVAKLRKEAEGEDEKPAKQKESKKQEPVKQPSRKPAPAKKELTLEEQYADQIELIDLDIPKAQKALKNWLEDEDRTDDELAEIIEKWPKEEEPEPVVQKTAKSSKKEAETDDLDAEVAKALERFKSKKK